MGTATLLLDASAWDLILDANGNIAVATTPYSLAQDAASAIKTFIGEVYYNTQLGVPYLTQILGKNPPLALLKAQFVTAALTVPGIASAKCFITAVSGRGITGQVQIKTTTRQSAAATFTVINPQGVG